MSQTISPPRKKRQADRDDEFARRGLRKKLRSDAEEIKANRDSIISDRDGAFERTLQQVESRSAAIVKPRESVLDAGNFGAMAKILQLQTASLNSSDCTKPEIEAIVRAMRSKFSLRRSAFDWNAMGTSVAVFFRSTPTMSLLRGPLQMKETQRKSRRSRAMHGVNSWPQMHPAIP